MPMVYRGMVMAVDEDKWGIAHSLSRITHLCPSFFGKGEGEFDKNWLNPTWAIGELKKRMISEKF